MKTTVDERFLREARAGALRFRCDDCAHFDDLAARCAHGYPVAAHRPRALAPGRVVVFCKEFELGAPPDEAR